MDDLTLALKLTGKEKATEEKSESLNPSTASIVYMIAVTASSGGEVVLKDEIDESAEWEEGDFIEVDEEGDYEEYESDDDPLEDVDDAVVDMTDGDGVDIDDTGSDSIAYTVADYHEDAVAAYSEEEGDVVVDDLPDENTGISDAIDDGDATELPDDGTPSFEDGLPDENATIDEISDDDYTLTDDNSDDESDEIEGAEVSDGYTVADCIGSIKAGDRVSVLIQGGKATVLGVVGSGDEEEALRRQAEEAAAEANELAESASENADEAKESAKQAETKAKEAIKAAEDAKQQAESAETSAKSASESAEKVETGLQKITDDLLTVKTDASQTLAQAIDATTEKKIEVMTTSFATKGELKEQAIDLKSEIVRSAGKIQTTLEASYTRKTDLTEAKVEMQSQIAQTAELIEMTVLDITDAMVNTQDETIKAQIAQAKIDFENAKASLETAKTTLAEAQKNEQIAKDNAAAAQNALSDANAELASAQNDLAKAQSHYNMLVEFGFSTEEIESAANDVVEAENAVESATTKVNRAIEEANAASLAVTNAANTVATAEANVESAQVAYNLAVEGLHTYNMTAIKQTADAITLKASKKDLEGYVTTTTFQVTAEGFTTEINTAKTTATNAAKTATNFMSYDSTNGLLIGNKTSGSWSGSRAQILPTAFNILGSDGKALASYQANQIDLGMNSDATVINLCGGTGTIRSDSAAIGTQWHKMQIEADHSIALKTGGAISLSAYWERTSTTYTSSAITLQSRAPWTNSADVASLLISLDRHENGSNFAESMIFSDGEIRLDVINNVEQLNAWLYLRAYDGITSCTIRANDIFTSGRLSVNEDIYIETNNRALHGMTTNGASRRIIVLNASNNCVINYDSYVANDGNANIYGSDVNIYSAKAGSVGYKPYYRAGDSVEITVNETGFISSESDNIYFAIPLEKPVLGNPTITITSTSGLRVRQGSKYVYGSSSSSFATPTSISVERFNGYLKLDVRMPNTTNAINNDTCGIAGSFKITFS